MSCALGVDIRFTGDDTLKRRPVRSLLSSLHDLGANVDPTIEYAPYNICGPLLGGHTSIRCMTGQYLTALLLAAPLAKEDITIDVYLLKERTAVRTTEIWLEKEGIDFFRDHDMNHYTIRGNQSYKNLETDIIGKYVEKLLYLGPAPNSAPGQEKEGSVIPGSGASKGASKGKSSSSGGITRDFLLKNGF